MCDDDVHVGLIEDTLSRRTFAALAAGAATMASSAAQAAANIAGVTEKDVMVRTPDGQADAALYYPAGKGPWPAVLIWCDFLSLRPVFREMGRRLASEGYVVLVPNFYYRSEKAPVLGGKFDFNNPDDRAKLAPFRAALTPEAAERDAKAYVAFLDAQPQTDRKKGVGVQGYCMGGPLTVRTAIVAPERVRASAAFHSGALVTENDPNSLHLRAAKSKSAFLILPGDNDDKQRPTEKDVLKKTFADAGRPAHIEVYPAPHGWCVRGSAQYNEAEAERAWAALLKFYKTNLS